MADGLYVPPPHGIAPWEEIGVDDAGWNLEALQTTAAWLGSHDTDAFVVLDHGRIVFEQRWNETVETTSADVYSAQKSVVCFAINVLVSRGLVDLDAPASTWLGSGWTNATPAQEERITLLHLMTMTTGLYDDFGFEADPGTTRYYNNNAYHQIRRIIETVTGAAANDAFADLLFSPLGMASAEWRERPGAVDPSGRPLSGLFMTARDLARFGLAVLAGGSWAGTELIDDTSLLHVSLRPSQTLNPAYGRLWWLKDQACGIVPGPPRGGDLHAQKSFGGRVVNHALAPSAPPGTVAAMGAADQRLYLVPDRRILVVRTGRSIYDTTAAAGNADEAFWQLLKPALPEEESR